MEVIHPRCCGIDVHKELVVVCLRLQQDRRMPPAETTSLLIVTPNCYSTVRKNERLLP